MGFLPLDARFPMPAEQRAESATARMMKEYGRVLPHHYYERPTIDVARDLLGRVLVHRSDDGDLAGVIVETEAYGPDDPANHAHRGATTRNAVMFGPAGFAYVYRIYGMYWCVNAVTMGGGIGEAVLIRALEPVAGIAKMQRSRGVEDERRLCAGPGNLCKALGITGDLNGADLALDRLFICEGAPLHRPIIATTRIGITKAADLPWRFYFADSLSVSRKERPPNDGRRFNPKSDSPSVAGESRPDSPSVAGESRREIRNP